MSLEANLVGRESLIRKNCWELSEMLNLVARKGEANMPNLDLINREPFFKAEKRPAMPEMPTRTKLEE